MADNAECIAELHAAEARIWDVERRLADAIDDARRAAEALDRCAPACELVDGDLEGDYDDARAELDIAARSLRNVLRIAEQHAARVAVQLAEAAR